MRNTQNYKKVPENVMILGENQYYSRNCYETQLNNNVVVVGTSGAGKTRSIVKPNLMQATGSYVVSDPKGTLAKEMGPYLKSKGYRVLSMDFIHPERSLHYDPLAFCRTTRDIQKLAHTLAYGSTDNGRKGGSYDPFWDEITAVLFAAVIGYLKERELYEEEKSTLLSLIDIIKLANRDKPFTSDRGCSILDDIMKEHMEILEEMGMRSFGYERYCDYNTAPNKTHATINVCALAKLATIDCDETREMLRYNDIDFTSIGEEPTVVFVQVSDTDRSLDALVNLFYSQMMNELCMYADEKCRNHCLPVPVQFILDDFATNARIDNFQNIISNIRSRGISAMIMIQSENQLEAGYGNNAKTIIDNCNTYVYMGGSDPHQAEEIALRANKSTSAILNMPVFTSWIFRRGEEPVLCNNFDLEWFQKEKGFISRIQEESDIEREDG